MLIFLWNRIASGLENTAGSLEMSFPFSFCASPFFHVLSWPHQLSLSTQRLCRIISWTWSFFGLLARLFNDLHIPQSHVLTSVYDFLILVSDFTPIVFALLSRWLWAEGTSLAALIFRKNMFLSLSLSLSLSLRFSTQNDSWWWWSEMPISITS
jgi:hypothetical protein